MLEYAQEKGYVPLSKIIEVFNNPSEELLDDVVKYLENANIEVTRDSEDVPNEEELLIEKSMTSSSFHRRRSRRRI